MFNILVSADGTAWESGHRMGMDVSRFREYSGDESGDIALDRPHSLKLLEQVKTLLMYEDGIMSPNGTTPPNADLVRVGQLRDIRLVGGRLTFRFAEEGQFTKAVVRGALYKFQMDKWELNRTHWAVKDGQLAQDVLASVTPTPRSYDIVMSFAGENRNYVEQVVEVLAARGVDSFYDVYEEVTLWGKDLVAHFDSIYRKQGRYCVMFISRHYAEKVWTRYECRVALARALEQRAEYVLPARFDKTDIPGLPPTIGYLDLTTLTPHDLAERILQKLGRA